MAQGAKYRAIVTHLFLTYWNRLKYINPIRNFKPKLPCTASRNHTWRNRILTTWPGAGGRLRGKLRHSAGTSTTDGFGKRNPTTARHPRQAVPYCATVPWPARRAARARIDGETGRSRL